MSKPRLDITRQPFPCKGCKDRFVKMDDDGNVTTCHSVCAKYIEAKEMRDEERERIREIKQAEEISNDFKMKTIIATKKRAGRKWRQ